MVARTPVQVLRDNIADTGVDPAWTNEELADLLTAAGGVEPRARLAALLPLWTEAAGHTDYSIGTVSEKASGAFAMLKQLMEQAQAEVGALDAAEQATQQAGMWSTSAVAVQVVF